MEGLLRGAAASVASDGGCDLRRVGPHQIHTEGKRGSDRKRGVGDGGVGGGTQHALLTPPHFYSPVWPKSPHQREVNDCRGD